MVRIIQDENKQFSKGVQTMSKIAQTSEPTNHIAVFQETAIRRTWHAEAWWFSIIDVVEVLVGGDRPRKYWNDLKKKLAAEGYFEVSEKIGQLKMAAPDGKQRLTDCASPFKGEVGRGMGYDAERPIQPIPTPALPLKGRE